MDPVVASIEIARPAAEVFAYATDPHRFHEWQRGVVADQRPAPAPTAAGDQCVTRRRIGFAERSIRSRATVVDPPRRWEIEGIDGPVRARVNVSVDELAETGSRLTIAIRFDGHGIGRLLVPLVVLPQARREMPVNLEELRRRVEGPAQDR